MGLRLAMVSTYPPRQCGIATFAAHLRGGLLAAGADEVAVVAMLKEDATDVQRPEVIATIREEHASDYREAARLLNQQGYDAVLLQHEFGIFGGTAGCLVNELLDSLEIPVIATLHTILSEPGPEYRQGMEQLLHRIQAAVVMAERGGQILRDVYGFSRDRIFHIPHGVPKAPPGTREDWKKRLGVDGRVVAMTFGLIGPGKGIETALRALSLAVSQCPALLYLIVGATHPEVLRKEGERYRRSLEQLVAELGMEQHVRFVNRYLSDDELLGYLMAADLYISPYPGAQQITSGTLTYALAMGKAIVSTPYTYAQELLADGAGVLVPFNDWEAMGQVIGELARDQKMREALSAKARERGEGFAWPSVGGRYLQLAERLRGGVYVLAGGSRNWDESGETEELPTPSLDHLIRMTDDTGMIQHAIGPVPNRDTGYTSDDNARALLVSVWAAEAGHPEAERLAETYLAFLAYALRPDRWFHNFFGYDRRAIPEDHSEDCQGRCLWGLAAAARHWAGRSHGWTAAHLFASGLQPCRSFRWVRGLAGLVVAGTEWLEAVESGSRPEGGPDDAEVRNLVVTAADNLVTTWERNRDINWEWFEDCLTYDNAVPPFALLRAARITGQASYREAGLATLEFLARVTFRDKVFWPIGNRGWYPRNGRRADFDQQPLEAAMMVLACREAAAVTGDSAWMELAHHAARWFVGQNALGVSMVDEDTGGCHDGLEEDGVNPNQGAESSLAWLMAAYALQRRPAFTSAAR
ncbi:MAG TPA: glycosyltransferase family 4 protein [Symbiobacteriaceae bacterium]